MQHKGNSWHFLSCNKCQKASSNPFLFSYLEWDTPFWPSSLTCATRSHLNESCMHEKCPPWIINVTCHTVNSLMPVLRFGIKPLWAKSSHLRCCLTSQTCLFKYSKALPHSRQIISARWYRLRFLSPAYGFKGLYCLALVDGTQEKRGGGGAVAWVLKAEQSSSGGGGLCPTVSCRVCCCFAEGLWEVLALRGQHWTPPSSCFDRHPALTQTFSLFHFIGGPFPISGKAGVAWCDCTVKVRLAYYR